MVRDEAHPPQEGEYEAEIGRSGDRFQPTARRGRDNRRSSRRKAREYKGLWNFWLTGSDKGYGLTTVEYAYLAEEMGWSMLASEAFNCSAPDTGNMEVIEHFGSPEQKRRWLPDLLEGSARSAYLMTEPGVASSDATNIAMDAAPRGRRMECSTAKNGGPQTGDPRCSLLIVMALTDPTGSRHGRHSMLLVPASTKGVEKLRAMTVYGNDDAPHGHMHIRFTDVRVPRDALVLGRGRGFEIARKAASGLGASTIVRRDRPGRAGAGGDVPPGRRARSLRQEARRAGRQPRHHRRGAHEHRDGAPALPQDRLDDGYRKALRAAAPLDLADQE